MKSGVLFLFLECAWGWSKALYQGLCWGGFEKERSIAYSLSFQIKNSDLGNTMSFRLQLFLKEIVLKRSLGFHVFELVGCSALLFQDLSISMWSPMGFILGIDCSSIHPQDIPMRDLRGYGRKGLSYFLGDEIRCSDQKKDEKTFSAEREYLSSHK